MTIGIIGHGYVGLVTAAVFADLGNTVKVVGHTPEKVHRLNKGMMPFYEPGLEEMVKRNLEAGRLSFSLDITGSIQEAKIVFICVGTPSLPSGEADLSAVFSVARTIGSSLKSYTVIVTKSTVPVGTNRKVGKIIREETRGKTPFDIASCPEFLREGSALSDTLNPDRIVIGADTERARKLLLEVHKPINGERIVTSIETAEMIKYASNSLLATKISFANAMSFICEAVHADVETVLNGVGLDRRLGRNFLYPGVGFGGSCFPKDVKALIAIAQHHGYDFQLLKAVYQINQEAKKRFIDSVIQTMKPIKGKRIGVWGLAFKPNTDDMREAPSLDIIRGLVKRGAAVRAFDPVAMENAHTHLPEIEMVRRPQDAVKNAHALVVLTEWNEFKQIDLKEVRTMMAGPFLFDGRNMYDPKQVKKIGFIYKGIGRE